MTLTQAAHLTKRGIVAFFIVLILGISAKVGVDIWYQNYLANLPKVEEKAEMKFGQLSALKFPSEVVTSSNFSYSLDTTTGNVPETPKLMKVYFMPQANLSLLAPERSKKLAQNFGFDLGPEQLSATKHRFTSSEGGSIVIDLPTGNFNFKKSTQEATSSSEVTVAALTDKQQIVKDFKNFLISKGLLQEGLDKGKNNVRVGDLNKKEPTTISLWPTDTDNLPIVNPLFKDGLVRATLNQTEASKESYGELNYFYWPIDLTTYSTYPLKTATQAFSELEQGKGFISLDPKTANVSITSIYLAYYQTEEYSPYLQPVFVFEGPDFAALVPAIAPISN